MGVTLFVILLILFGLWWFINEPLPKGATGPEADALAKKMMEAVNVEAWKETGAVSWNFSGRRDLLWDKKRHLAKVSWKGNVVLVDNNTLKGKVLKKNPEEQKEDAKLIEEAWKIWVNDSFWLNPISKLFDPGTERKLVKYKERDALLISYKSGGATPGDSYLWIPDQNGQPEAWKLWVSILSIKGYEFSWEKWVTLPTGAKVSTFHHSRFRDVVLSDVQAAGSLEGLVGKEDPFAPLFKK